MSLFVCAKCGCVDNTATSSYWMLTNEYMVDKFEYAKELQPYKGMGLCSECGRLTTSPDGRDVVIEKGFVDKEMFEYKFDYISSALEDYTNISVYNFYCDNNDKDNINRKPNTGMIDQYMDYIKFINDNVDEENKIIYDTIMMIGDASGKEGQFSDSDKKTAENFGCEYMDVDDFVYKYKD